MSADELHARCIREEPAGEYVDVFPDWAATPVHHAWLHLFDGHDAGALSHNNGGLDEICDEARDLADFITTQASPHRRYQALVGVLGFLLLTLVEGFDRAASKPTATE